jgi:hypothetical protein
MAGGLFMRFRQLPFEALANNRSAFFMWSTAENQSLYMGKRYAQGDGPRAPKAPIF